MKPPRKCSISSPYCRPRSVPHSRSCRVYRPISNRSGKVDPWLLLVQQFGVVKIDMPPAGALIPEKFLPADEPSPPGPDIGLYAVWPGLLKRYAVDGHEDVHARGRPSDLVEET